MMPIVRRTLELMDELGMIALPLKVNGLQVSVIPVAPLAMASNVDRVQDILSFLQIAQQLGPVGGSLIKLDKVGDYLADHFAVPAELRTTPEEREIIMQQTMAIAQQQMENQQPQEQMENMQDG